MATKLGKFTDSVVSFAMVCVLPHSLPRFTAASANGNKRRKNNSCLQDRETADFLAVANDVDNGCDLAGIHRNLERADSVLATASRQPAMSARAPVGRHRRDEAVALLPRPLDRLKIGPDARRKSSEKGRAKRGRFEVLRPLHRDLQNVGEELAEPGVGRHAAVDPNASTGKAKSRAIASIRSSDW